MASTGFTNPGTAVNDASAGTAGAWAPVSNALTSDDTRATTGTIKTSVTSQYLNLTNFGFAIPSDAAILGVTMRLERRANTSSNLIVDHTIQLMVSGSRAGDNKADTITNWGTTDTQITYGGASDLWGNSLTAAIINSSDFGISIRVAGDGSGTSGAAAVDVAQISIEYQTSVAVTPSRRDLLLTSFDPVVQLTTHRSIAPSSGNVLLSSAAPVIVWTDNRVSTPDQQNLLLSTAAPSVVWTDHNFTLPAAGNLVLSTVAPTAELANKNISPAAAQLTLTTVVPILGATTPAGNLLLSTVAPSIVVSTVRQPAAAQAVLSTVAPSRTTNIVLTIGQGNIVLSSVAPTGGITVLKAGDAGQLALSTTAPILSISLLSSASLLGSASVSAAPTTPYITMITNPRIQLVYTAEISLWARADR